MNFTLSSYMHIQAYGMLSQFQSRSLHGKANMFAMSAFETLETMLGTLKIFPQRAETQPTEA